MADVQKEELRMQKKLRKMTKDIEMGLNLESQPKSLPLERVKEKRENPLFSKLILSTLGTAVLILIFSYVIYGIITGKIPIYDLITGLFN